MAITLSGDGIARANLAADVIDATKIEDDAVGTEHLANAINTEIAANTAKTTNATHTGDVTGATALTIAVDAVDIAMLSATGTASSSTFLRGDNTWAAAGDDNAPYFYVGLTGTQTVTDGAWDKIDFDNEILDSGGMFASGTFTPTVAGKYFVSLSVTMSGANNSTYYQGDISIRKNDTHYAVVGTDQSSNYGKTAANAVSTIIDMNGSSDYIEAYINMNNVGGTSSASGEATHFLGYRIG